MTFPSSPPAVLTDTIRAQLEHRTIRAFTDEPLAPSVVDTLIDVANHAPTSSFYQSRTVIRVADPERREAIHLSSGQPYVGGDRGALFVFVADLYRAAQIRTAAGVDLRVLESTPLFLQAVEDALIAAQNMVLAAESLGLGTVYLGSIGGDARRVIRALELPERTYPIVGLLVGHAAQTPQIKPRLPREVFSAVDAYPRIEDVGATLAGYDCVVKTYYDLRDTSRRVDSFSRQIATKPGTGQAELAPTREILTEQKLALY